MCWKKVLKPVQKRELARVIQNDFRVSTRRSCRLVHVHPSVYYYHPHRRDDTALRMRLIELSNIRVRYGIQRLHILLRCEGWKDNHKRVYRIYCEEGLNLRRKRNKRIKSARNRVPTNGVASCLHECWSMDFMSDALFDGKKFRVLTLVDNYSPKSLVLHTGEDVAEILKKHYLWRASLTTADLDW